MIEGGNPENRRFLIRCDPQTAVISFVPKSQRSGTRAESIARFTTQPVPGDTPIIEQSHIPGLHGIELPEGKIIFVDNRLVLIFPSDPPLNRIPPYGKAPFFFHRKGPISEFYRAHRYLVTLYREHRWCAAALGGEELSSRTKARIDGIPLHCNFHPFHDDLIQAASACIIQSYQQVPTAVRKGQRFFMLIRKDRLCF